MVLMFPEAAAWSKCQLGLATKQTAPAVQVAVRVGFHRPARHPGLPFPEPKPEPTPTPKPKPKPKPKPNPNP